MRYLILFVLHEQKLMHDVLESWEKAGVNGITVLFSTGLKRLQAMDVLREDLPLIPSLEDFIQQEERLNRTLITIVQDDEMVDKVVDATQSITGDLNLPNTGILTVLPVARVYGLDRKTLFNEDPDA
jgi:nitrogen regulatory protein P-II 1